MADDVPGPQEAAEVGRLALSVEDRTFLEHVVVACDDWDDFGLTHGQIDRLGGLIAHLLEVLS